MKHHNFSQRSLDQIKTLDEDLQLICFESLKVTQVDFVVIEGARDIKRQRDLFRDKLSQVNPDAFADLTTLLTKGKHLIAPGIRDKSWAFDFIAYVPGRKDLIYDFHHIMYLVGVFTSVAERLLQEGKIRSIIRSGTNWDRDGVLKYDQSFFDAPHIEILRKI